MDMNKITNAFYDEDYKKLEKLTGIKAKSQIEFEEKYNSLLLKEVEDENAH